MKTASPPIPPLSEDEIENLNACDEITPEDIARLDYRIASEGRASAEKWAPILGYPGALVKERIKAYEDDLQARGLTPVQAAIEARRAKLLAHKLATGPEKQQERASPSDPLPAPCSKLQASAPVRRTTQIQRQVETFLNSSKASAELATKVLQDSKSSVVKSTTGTEIIHLNPPKTPVNPHNPPKST